jgi:hypothetical protein
MPDSNDEILNMLRQMTEAQKTGGLKIFNEREAEALASIAEVEMRYPGAFAAWASLWQRLEAVGWAGRSLKSVLTWAVAVIAAWAALKAGLIQWLADQIGRQ